MAEEMTVLPGMDELGNLLWIADHVDQGDVRPDRGRRRADRRDAAPAVSLPEASRWWIEKIAPIGRRVQKLGGPLLRRIVGVPLPRDEVYEAAEQLLERLQVRARPAGRPRPLVGAARAQPGEASRSRRRSARSPTSTCTAIPTDLIVANRVLPAASRRLLRRVARGPGALPADGRASSSRPVPVRTVPVLRQGDGRPRAAAPSSARRCSATSDPHEFLYRGRPYSVAREDGGYTLAVELPFTSREEIALSRNGDELVLQVGGVAP